MAAMTLPCAVVLRSAEVIVLMASAEVVAAESVVCPSVVAPLTDKVPKLAACAYRLVLEARVAKKEVVVAAVPVALVKFSLFTCVVPEKVLLSARSVLEAAERPVSVPHTTWPPFESCSAEAPTQAPVARKSAEVEALWVKSVVDVLLVLVLLPSVTLPKVELPVTASVERVALVAVSVVIVPFVNTPFVANRLVEVALVEVAAT